MPRIVTLKRLLTYAWLSFRRNGWLSTATILVMMLTLFVIGGLTMLSVVANTVLNDLENKIDIAVFFKLGTDEEEILKIKRELETLAAVKEVSYVSAVAALAEFKERHKSEPAVLASLEELGDENPLPASLNIKAQNPSELSSIAAYLQEKNFAPVEKINYFENQAIIERLSSMVRGVRSAGVGTVLVLGFIAVLVAFNTVRLAIYTAREEINIMKLVGATNWYIRGPFMIEGIFYGGIAAIATALAFLPVIWVIFPKILLILPNVNLLQYFTANFLQFFLILFVIGVALGVGSSALAIRRYLKI